MSRLYKLQPKFPPRAQKCVRNGLNTVVCVGCCCLVLFQEANSIPFLLVLCSDGICHDLSPFTMADLASYPHQGYTNSAFGFSLARPSSKECKALQGDHVSACPRSSCVPALPFTLRANNPCEMLSSEGKAPKLQRCGGGAQWSPWHCAAPGKLQCISNPALLVLFSQLCICIAFRRLMTPSDKIQASCYDSLCVYFILIDFYFVLHLSLSNEPSFQYPLICFPFMTHLSFIPDIHHFSYFVLALIAFSF